MASPGCRRRRHAARLRMTFDRALQAEPGPIFGEEFVSLLGEKEGPASARRRGPWARMRREKPAEAVPDRRCGR